MLSQGILRLNNISYNVYELDSNGGTRLDIVGENGMFHTDTDKVVYSHYGKKTKMYFGSKSVYMELQDIKNRLERLPGKEAVKSFWEGGAFVEETTKEISELQCIIKRKENGVSESYTYTDGSDFLTMKVVDSNANYFVEPINKSEYSRTLLDRVATAVNSAFEYLTAAILRAMYDLDWIDEVDYEVVDTMPRFEECMQLWEDYDDEAFTGFDWETNMLEVMLHSDLRIAGLVLSPWEGTSWYIPFGHDKFDNLPFELIFTRIYDICIKKRLVAHNKKYERKVILKIAMDKLKREPDWDYLTFLHKFKIREDSLILEFLINPVLVKGSHSLKHLGYVLRKRVYVELSQIFKDKKSIYFPALDKETARIYACPDADNCRAIRERRWDDLPTKTQALYELECELADHKASQEFWGVRVGMVGLLEQKKVLEENIKRLELLINKLARVTIKLTSGPQLSELLFKMLKCPIITLTKTKQASTSSAALKKLGGIKKEDDKITFLEDVMGATTGKPDDKPKPLFTADELNKVKYPIVKLIERHREYNKLLTAFFERISTRSVNSRYGFWINQNGTASGRQSSPIHQLPKPAKRYMYADSEDHIIVDADYSCIELRLTFSMAGETELIELCSDPDNDIHRIIDQLITNVEMWAISSDMRQLSKRRNFGTVYGISGRGLAAQIFGANPTDEQIAQCEKAIIAFYTRFKKVFLMVEDNKRKIIEKGEIQTYFYRTRYFPQIFDPTYPDEKKAALQRQGNNTPIQGTAADIMKMAERNIELACERLGWDKLVDTPQGKFPLFRVMLSAHDEVVCSAHKSLPQWKILAVLKQCMEVRIKDFCPLYTGVCFVDNWEEGKADAYQIPVRLRDKIIEDKSMHFTDNIKDSILEIINEYRDSELIGFMENLIKECKSEDPNVVWESVRHPSLTHDLIARYPSPKGTEHLDCIRNATKAYCEARKDPEFKLVQTVKSYETSESDENRDIVNSYTDFDVEAIFNYDAEGNIITDDPDTDSLFEDEDYTYRSADSKTDFNYVNKVLSEEDMLVWELFDSTFIEAAGLTKSDLDELVDLIWKYHNPHAYSRVYIHYCGESLDTEARCDKIDKKKIAEFLMEKKRVNVGAMR